MKRSFGSVSLHLIHLSSHGIFFFHCNSLNTSNYQCKIADWTEYIICANMYIIGYSTYV